MEDLKLSIAGKKFEAIRQVNANNEEFWFASAFMEALGYTNWTEFSVLIDRAKAACARSGFKVEDHFHRVTSQISINRQATGVYDIALTRYACYLIAQNGDPRSNQEIALAQTYFAFQTRKQEVQQERMGALERLLARQKLSQTEKEFAGVLFERGIDGRGLAIIKSAGDKALFGGRTTKQMKDKLGIRGNRPIADFLPTITIKAKDLAAEMTTFKTKEKGLKSGNQIMHTHESHNTSVREVLTDEGIYPEHLPPEEDIKKLERRIKKVGQLDKIKKLKK